MKTDTPRTDAAIQTVAVAFIGYEGLSSSDEQYVSPDFARELERENARMNAGLTELARELLAGGTVAPQDGLWHVFQPNGESLTAGAGTLAELVLSLAKE